MYKSLIYLKSILETYESLEIKTYVLEKFLSKYLEKNYLNDTYLLKLLDFSILNDNYFNNKFDYKKHVNFQIKKDSVIFIFLNGNFFSIDCDLFFFENTFMNSKSMPINFFNMSDEKVLENINIFFIFNLLLNNNINCFNFDKRFSNKNVYILNFFTSNKENVILYSKTSIKVEAGINLNILEGSFILSNNLFLNSNTFLLLEEKSEVNYIFLNDSDKQSVCAHSFYSNLLKNSTLSYTQQIFGCKFLKNYYYFFLSEEFSKLTSNFPSFLDNNLFHDINLKVFHLGSNSYSRSIFKSVLSNFSTCNFNGLIDVDIDVLSVDSGLMCKGILLDKSSSLKISPELAIKNNDVKCFHGATIGFLNEELLFYLMSRGYSKNDAVSFLVCIFFNEIIYTKTVYIFDISDFLFNKYYISNYEFKLY